MMMKHKYIIFQKRKNVEIRIFCKRKLENVEEIVQSCAGRQKHYE